MVFPLIFLNFFLNLKDLMFNPCTRSRYPYGTIFLTLIPNRTYRYSTLVTSYRVLM